MAVEGLFLALTRKAAAGKLKSRLLAARAIAGGSSTRCPTILTIAASYFRLVDITVARTMATGIRYI